MNNLLALNTRTDLRIWLENNHNIEKECWVYCHQTKILNDHSLYYLDIVEECLCFGWIDSTRKKLNDTKTILRLTPRRSKSNWTELNKERVRRLEKLSLMTSAGRLVLPSDFNEPFVIDDDILKLLKSDDKTWINYSNFPALYKVIRLDNIQGNRSNENLFKARLEKFLENTSKGIMYGYWNDDGRLCE